MENKPILFCTPKWCDANPAAGLTNDYHNLFGSLEHSINIPFNVLHFDEPVIRHGTHIDKILPKVIDKLIPKVVIFSLLGKSNLNPSRPAYEYLKNKGIYLVFQWADADNEWSISEINKIGKLADLHVSWDNAGVLRNIQNHINLWAPQDDKLYYDQRDKNIDVGFIGSLRYQERQTYIKYLLDNDVKLVVRGGQREEKLTSYQYAEFIRNCKIGINFPWSPFLNMDQCKGRVFEIIASNSMLLERKNDVTSKVLSPGVDYVEFTSPDDLKNKINYFLNNHEERLKIAQHGHETFLKKYSATIFWKKIFEKIRKDGIDI